MKIPEPLLNVLAVPRRVLTVGFLAAFLALGTTACDDVLPNVDVEQGEEDGEGQDDGDQDEDGDEDQDEDGDQDDGGDEDDD